MSVKALLDDAAAEATLGLRIDVRAAYVRSNQRRARARWRASAMMASAVAVAAVVALIAVALPAGGWLHRGAADPATPSTRPTGLPDRWYALNSWAPPLRRTPMAAASMVLATGSDVQLVSADGTSYARLPWSSGEEQVALSADGQDVAWVSPGHGDGGEAGPVIHRIRLRDGERRDVTLPAGADQRVVRQVIWAGHELYVVSSGPAAGAPAHTWRLGETSGVPVSVCDCGPTPLGVDGAGRLRQPALAAGPSARLKSELPGVALAPQWSGAKATTDAAGTPTASPQLMVDPSGERSASVIATALAPAKVGVRTPMRFELAITNSSPSGTGTGGTFRFPVTGADQITDVRLLGWSRAGLIVRVKSLKNRGLDADNISIRLITPDGSLSRVISRAAWRQADPIAVAPEVVGTGVTVPGRAPRFSSTDRAHLEFLFRRGWYVFGSRATAALLVVLGLGTILLARRRRRMRTWRVGEEG